MVQAAFWFAVMALLVKLAAERGLPTMQIVLARAVVTLALSTVGLVRAKQPPWGENNRLLVLRGVFGSGGFICFYAAVIHLPLAEATVIHHISPVLTAVVASLWLGERLERRVLLGMALAFAGVILIAQPAALFGGDAAATGISWTYVAVGVAGALLASFAYVSVRKLGETEPPILVVFYFPAISVPVSLPFAIAEWVPPDLQGWLLLLGVGAATQVAQLALTKGLARERAGKAISVGYLQIAFAMAFGALLFGQIPGTWSLAGIALVVGSVFFAQRA
ncbi:MAG: EamA family transporter [Planctomycetes bacterium]|nr:EamA family transporter [Planctomycetota bacterium]